MNVHPVADELGVGLGREDHAVPEPVCGGARHLAGDHRVIGCGQGRLRHHRHFELARTVLGEKGVGNHPGRPQGRDETLAKGALSAKGAEGVGVARTVRRSRCRRTPARTRRSVAGSPPLRVARTARRRKSRGQHSQAVPSVLQMSPRKKCSIAEPSAKSTRTSTAGSGTIMKSPAVPNGVSQIGPNGDIIKLLPVQPIPFLRRSGSSRAGNPLPRARPEMSQVATKISSSRIMPPPRRFLAASD